MFLLCVLCGLCGCCGFVIRAQEPQRPVPTAVWAAKPSQPPAYPPGQKVWNKLPDLKAKHQGEANWREVLVDDGRLTGEYVAAAPGTRVAKRLHPDTREWFAVVEGEVRVEIEGQTPLTATRGSVVNIPRQTIYSLETIGDKPSLRWVVALCGNGATTGLRKPMRRAGFIGLLAGILAKRGMMVIFVAMGLSGRTERRIRGCANICGLRGP